MLTSTRKKQERLRKKLGMAEANLAAFNYINSGVSFIT